MTAGHEDQSRNLLGLNHEEFKVLYLTWAVIGVLIVFTILVRIGMNMKKIGTSQAMAELVVEKLEGFVVGLMGEHRASIFYPLILAQFLYILLCNFMGIFPFSISPTNSLNTNIPLALITFTSFMTYSFVALKIGGLKRFLGPVMFLAPLMMVIELVGEFSKPFSLSVRLFGNMWGEELAHDILFQLLPALGPLPIKFLMVLTDVLQAFVFIILSMVYINLASEHEH